MRLSFPHESKRFESIAFHATFRMPLSWPRVSLKGYWQFRRSHICIEGLRSSSKATRSCVSTSGFQATLEQRERPAGSLKLMTSFCCLRSQTTVVPALELDANMCCTFRFHAQHKTSEPACLLVAEGLYTCGAAGSAVMLRMLTSPSAPAVAMRLGIEGWHSTQLTVPEWTWLECSKPVSWPRELIMADGFHKDTTPSWSPPATTPRGYALLSTPNLLQERDEKRRLPSVLMEAIVSTSEPGRARSKFANVSDDSEPERSPAALLVELPKATSVGADSAAHHATVAVRGICFNG